MVEGFLSGRSKVPAWADPVKKAWQRSLTD